MVLVLLRLDTTRERNHILETRAAEPFTAGPHLAPCSYINQPAHPILHAVMQGIRKGKSWPHHLSPIDPDDCMPARGEATSCPTMRGCRCTTC